jgi:hypothetical protein
VTFDELKRILAALEREGVAYVLVGSMGMAAHGLVRATRDLDLFVNPVADNIERLRRALHALHDDPSIDEITSDDLAGDYPAVGYTPPDGRFSIDILARLGEAFRYEDLERVTAVIDGIALSVATPEMLYRMKKDTVRPQDRVDAAWLADRFGPWES